MTIPGSAGQAGGPATATPPATPAKTPPASVPVVPVVYEGFLGATPAGAPCVVTVVLPAAGVPMGVINTLDALWQQELAQNPPCPNTPTPPAGATPGVSPQGLAVQFWKSIALPVPHPSIPPGEAITGLVAYLVTGATTDPPAYSTDTPLGRLVVEAHGAYSVEWGDGTATSGPYAFEGEPWPDGRITHTYDFAGTVSVVVSEAWTATWSLGGASGTLGGLETRATIPGFHVGQIQAVLVPG